MERIPSIQTVENIEKQKRYRTIEREIIETLPTGESIERVVECNGENHRQCVDEITYDADGGIEYVDQLSRDELGQCDHQHS